MHVADAQRHDGKVAVVTGSTRGIGAAIAERLAIEGAAVVVTGRTETDGQQVVQRIRSEGGTARYVQLDLRDVKGIEALIDTTVTEFGRLDVLVNNAAVQTETAVDKVSLEDWNRILETNFRSYWLCGKYAADQIENGAIVNISSNHAFQTMPAHFPYNAVKAGINGMTKAMALDLGPEIRVNTINPGWVAVERTTADMSESEREELAAIHPVGRIGEPADVAAAASFLASDEAGFITGTSLLVDGGRSAVMQDDTLPNYRVTNRQDQAKP